MKLHIGLVLMLISNSVISASFDCNQQLNRVEKMICSDNELSKLDDELGALYKYMHKNKAERKEQRKWIRDRNKCENKNCIHEYYYKKIDTLTDYRLPIKTCIASPEELKDFASKDTRYFFSLDRETDLKGDSRNELIYKSGGCNAHCEYIVYEMQDGCIKEIASFTAREYDIKSRCIYINNVDDGSDSSYEPWCFTEE